MGIFGYIKKKEVENMIAEKLKSINVITEKEYSNKSFVFRNDASNLIQDDIDRQGFFKRQGLFYLKNPIRIKLSEQKIIGNWATQIYTDKPINLIEIANKSPQKYVRDSKVLGVIFRHFGKDKGEYAAVKIGGVEKGRDNACLKGRLNFDYYGNGEAHSVWFDFQNARWASSFTGWNIRGNWRNINHGVKMIEKEPFLHKDGKLKYDVSNMLDLKVDIENAKTYFDIRGLSFSKIELLGEDFKHYGDNLLYNLDCLDTELSLFVYDVKRNNRLGKIKANKIVPFGYSIRKGKVQIQMDRGVFNGEIITQLPKGFIT